MEPVERRLLLAATAAAEFAGTAFRPLEQNLRGWIEPAEHESPLADERHDDHASRPDWMTQTYAPASEFLFTPGGYLTGPQRGRPIELAGRFLAGSIERLGASAGVLAEPPIVTDAYRSDSNGVTHVYYRQQVNGLPVLNANVNVNVARDGSILSAGGWFMDAASSFEHLPTVPSLSANDAILSAADTLGLQVSRISNIVSVGDDPQRTTVLRNPQLSLDDIEAKLAYVATGPDTLELAWWTNLRLPDGSDWVELAVSHEGEKVVFGASYVAHATYQVYGYPLESPSEGTRSILANPWDVTASPLGWHDTNGVAGAEYTVTRGNNVNAYADIVSGNGFNTGDVQPDGTSSLTFQFPLDLSQPPSAYREAAVTNLFYWTNLVHDTSYRFGFNEVAGNFQVNNYGKGGTGNDPLLAEAQDYGGTNNANMSTPADGSSPRMQMYIWTDPNPDRDGDLDSGIIIHEYTHGISNRLTGGPSNASALSAQQSGGMGEGWSDYYSLMLTMKPTDTAARARGIGTYALNQPTTGVGIRAYRYSPNKSINPMTIGLYNSNNAVHYTGTLWCTALWDMTWLLIDRYGMQSNIRTGFDPLNVRGNALALQLVTDAMKLQPANPSFEQARNAILQADVALTGGQNQAEIWQAFAGRGMGDSFVSGASSSLTVTEAFDLPNPNPVVKSFAPQGVQLTPVTQVDLTFNEPINPSSFAIADDVLLTGPGGVNLTSTVTGFSWVTPTQLRLTLSPSSLIGTYSLEIGPNISAADNGQPMDGNSNGIVGEFADRFTGTFSLQATLGPEGFGYRSGGTALRGVNLVPGAAGVTTIVNGSDDGTGTINLGANTFNYYGTNYSTVYVNANGLVTFGSSSTSWLNSDLTSSPSQAALAVLWDDWRTDQTASGATDSAVLYKLEPDRLIIEWSDVVNRSSAGGAVTFQAILQLNTGSTPGTILFNYPDLTLSSSTYNQGASSSVGIKNSGTQGSQRLLVSQDRADHPLVGTGKAIRTTTDFTPPTVTSVRVDSSAWNDAFRSHLQSLGLGGGDGYALGGSVARLPWQAIDTLRITFSEDVIVTQADLSLHDGVGGIGQVVNAFSYDAPSRTATWSLAPVSAKKVQAWLLANVQDLRWGSLDGDGNGFEGDPMRRDYHVLVGDVTADGVVNKDDLAVIRARVGGVAGDGLYLAQADLDGNALIDNNDLVIAATALGAVLPNFAPRPAAPGSLSSAPLATTRSLRTTLFSDGGIQDNERLGEIVLA